MEFLTLASLIGRKNINMKNGITINIVTIFKLISE